MTFSFIYRPNWQLYYVFYEDMIKMHYGDEIILNMLLILYQYLYVSYVAYFILNLWDFILLLFIFNKLNLSLKKITTILYCSLSLSLIVNGYPFQISCKLVNQMVYERRNKIFKNEFFSECTLSNLEYPIVFNLKCVYR